MSVRHKRALLVHPGIYDAADPRAFPPWGALAVGSRLRSAGWDVEVLELNGQDIDAVLLSECERFVPGVIGFTTKLGLGAKRFVSGVKTLRGHYGQDIKIVAGGPLVSSFPNLHHPLWEGVDAIIEGEGEELLLQWLENAPSESVLLRGGAMGNLDENDWGFWWPRLQSYVKPSEYWPGMRVPGIHVSAARGCTRRCTFCYLNSHAQGARFRFMSASVLYARMREAYENLGVSGFYFVDDCFIDHGKRRLDEFIDLCLRDGSPFRIGCDVQLADLADTAMLERMYEAGFRNFYVGVESASSNTRRSLGKGSARLSPEQLLQRTLDRGFSLRASIGIGWPGEGVAEMEDTIALVQGVPSLAFDAFKFLPLPGTPLGDRVYWEARMRAPVSRGEMLADAYQDYSIYNDNYSEVDDEAFSELWLRFTALEADRLVAYSQSPL